MRGQINDVSSVQDNEKRVEEIMAKLLKAQRTMSYRLIDEELSQKRLRWYDENKDKLNLKGSK